MTTSDSQPVDSTPPTMPTLLAIFVLYYCISSVILGAVLVSSFASSEQLLFRAFFYEYHHLQSQGSILPIGMVFPLGIVFLYGTIKRYRYGWLTSVFLYLNTIVSNFVGIFQVLLWSVITPDLGFDYTDASGDLSFFLFRMIYPALFLYYFNTKAVLHYFDIDRATALKRLYQILALSAVIHFLILLVAPTVTRLPME